ncbi:glycoside hydrolase family 67 protein [Aureobasidium subglaciale EXF-2481]|uniref:Alpha-glucuronidase n=1 Tax=Aureobasidium subglaciale (strain EXF-2481) TaxID=1043005 RepID=A0A074XYB8_AURSE|nr:glycoside hydrolase family 67 protein [Aureobasidium subglaciale EXF-2481]KEQ90558.1 glycoside hydrolase family 67 protein [Aureobasidium subglaciale EXF-2481]
MRLISLLALCGLALAETDGGPVLTAGLELQQGIQSILGRTCQLANNTSRESNIVGTLDACVDTYGPLDHNVHLMEDGFWLSTEGDTVQILGPNERGALYGASEYLSMLAQGNFSSVAYASSPNANIRWVNQCDLTRATQHTRLLASVGINDGLGRIADVMRPYGVQIGISLYFSSPTSGIQGQANLTTFDPLDSGVVTWWSNVTDQLYDRIPDMAGYLVKANSEGQPGPLTYNRTLAEGANLFAKALQPHGGIVMFRAFVYNQLNESVWTADRANAAVDFFKPLDGEFDDNVVVQIKYGPIDFQVREATSPLFANLYDTSTAIELQVPQEYLGQQTYLVYLPPLWDTVLGFDMRVFNRSLGGYAAVVNVGTNQTWLGSHLSMANFYAYGRLAWDPLENTAKIHKNWTRLTFGLDQEVVNTITNMALESWPAYENYSGNLGVQTLTDILYTHFGPNPQSQDNDGWGQWTRADHDTIGMDRTVANGTGFSGTYPPEIATMYEDIETTPENLLLWFHHVNYTQQLKSGKTVIQHFYDAHYSGAETAQTFAKQWQTLDGKLDSQRFEEQIYRLKYQAGHSIVWRDAICDFYHNISGIYDVSNRVGNHPYRIEAESMTLNGYKTCAVSPFETASNYHAVVVSDNTTAGSVSTVLRFPSDVYDIGVNFYDLYGGKSKYEILINNKTMVRWTGDSEDYLSHTPSIYGHSARRITFEGLGIQTGDVFEIIGAADGIEPAPLNYVVFLPSGVLD